MIGDRIKELRIRNDITQADLAKRLQLSRSAINAWEMGISIPSTQYVIELANFFKVSADYILDISQEETINISGLSEDEKEIITKLLRYFATNKFIYKLLKSKKIQLTFEDLEDLADTDFSSLSDIYDLNDDKNMKENNKKSNSKNKNAANKKNLN